MRLTSFTDYSLRVLIFLAAHPDGRTTIAEIAERFDISEHHLTKIVHALGKAGFLDNVRGRGGGIRLARPATDINVYDVVLATEASVKPAECFDRSTNTCAITASCKLRDVLGEAVIAFYAVLRKYTLEDLVHNRRALAKVLFAEKGQRVAR
jgi:Rrf2 family transcriptional regulator, nitric oxide-sensitive transcriptional repressor